jgi:hypothetical protein
MTANQLEILLMERVTRFDLKKIAFETLEQIFSDKILDKDFLCGFERNEIKVIFDRFEYHINRRVGYPIIRTRIGLYIDDKDQVFLDDIEPIGYYELDTNLSGEVIDDWFVIEKKKYSDDREI